MKILLIDAMAAFLDFALRAEAQGHEVRLWLPKEKDGSRNTIGDGLVTKVPDWRGSMNWADLIVLSDNARFLGELEPWRRKGYPIFGPGKEGASWELERGTGQQVLEAAGISCIPSHVFSGYKEAIEFVTGTGKRYVSKPTGDADKALSYVSKGPADMLFMLDYWDRTQKVKVPFLLQEFIPGIEMAVGGWVGRDGFLGMFLENFEFKKLMPGDVGVNTGEMGTVMKYCPIEESKLAQEMLLPLEAQLIRQGYTGYIDVAVIIDKKGKPWPLEFTTRPGWPLMQIQQILHPDVAGWMLDAVNGKDTFRPSGQIAAGFVVAHADFPFNKLPRAVVSGFPVWGITDSNRYFIHPSEMKLGMAPDFSSGSLKHVPSLVSAGQYLLTVSGRDWSVAEAVAGAFSRVKQLEVPNSPVYRIDIGERLEKQLPELQEFGYAVSWEWKA
jgi:phosphoribosylamine--glycine ligase